MTRTLLLVLVTAFLCWSCDDGDSSSEDTLNPSQDLVTDTKEEEVSADLSTDDDDNEDVPEGDQGEDVEEDDGEAPELPEEVDEDTAPTSCEDFDSCLSNMDCGGDEVCWAPNESDVARCCVPGVPGSDEAGESCEGNESCAMGLCLERDDGASFCSGPCMGDLDCPAFMFCSDIFSWCVPKDAGWLPESCLDVELPQCAYNENCEEALRCENVASSEAPVYCCVEGPRGTKALGEACEEGTECTFGRCIGGLCSAYCDFDIDPCPDAGMLCNTIRGFCEGI